MPIKIPPTPPGDSARQGPSPDTGAAPAPGGAFRSYVLALLAGALMALSAYYLGLGALHATGNLPPPAFSNSLCADDKLRFLREHPVQAPDLLVVGSSMAWRNFDGEAVTGPPLNMRPLNGGFCGLQAHQAIFVANWLLDRNPGVAEVLMLAAPQDFTGCSRSSPEVFDVGDVADYLDGRVSPWPYFLKYFSPLSLARNARQVKERRTQQAPAGTLIFDRFGGGPLETDETRPTLSYWEMEPLDPGCFEALNRLASRLEREGRTFTLALTPVHPRWKLMHDPDGSRLNAFREELQGVLAKTHTVVWDGDAHWQPGEAAFTDAIHLRWSAVREFSRAVAAQLVPREPKAQVYAAPTAASSPLSPTPAATMSQ